jgi:hypothetical protein
MLRPHGGGFQDLATYARVEGFIHSDNVEAQIGKHFVKQLPVTFFEIM